MLHFQIMQIFVTTFLVGLIWTVQIVHYPAFADVAPAQFLEFHKNHSFRISIIVIPFMLAELILAMYWMGREINVFSLINAVLVLLIWLATFLISVPLHNRLIAGFDLSLINNLIQTNWIRTIFWSIKGILLYAYFFIYTKPQ